MSFNTYQNIEIDLGTSWLEELTNLMICNGEKEYRKAEVGGNVNSDGYGCIEVYSDGGWSKRSYGHNYNAASGIACIIGKKTKGVFVGVRNKYCSVWSIAERKGSTTGDHTCYKNWSGSSSAMEADIVVFSDTPNLLLIEIPVSSPV